MSGKAKGIVVAACRLMLGLIFLWAGLEKVAEPAAFGEAILNYQVLSRYASNLLAQYLPWLEIVVGLGLLTGFFTRASALLAGLLSLGFGLFVVSALARGLNVECGCFSGASKVSWLHFILDVLLVALSAYLYRLGAGEHSVDEMLSLETERVDGKSRDRGWLLLGGLLLGGNLLFLTLAPLAPTAANSPRTHFGVPGAKDSPPLVLDPPFLQLGKVKQEMEGHGVVTYTNVSAGPVKIVEVKSSCGCTVPKPSKETLQPGESGKLSVTFRPRGNRGLSHQNVRIHVQGWEEPIMLQVEADIEPVIEVTPGVVEVQVGKPVTVALRSHRPGMRFNIQRVDSPTPNLRIKTLPAKAGEMPSLEVSLSGPLPPPPKGQAVWTVPIILDSTSAILYVKEKGE